jgi:hypothetical protein
MDKGWVVQFPLITYIFAHVTIMATVKYMKFDIKNYFTLLKAPGQNILIYLINLFNLFNSEPKIAITKIFLL